MAKIKPPKWITEIWGKVDNSRWVYRRGRKTTVLEVDPTPSYSRSKGQNNVRKAYRKALDDWRSLSPEQKQEYNRKAYGLSMSGYNLFMKERLLYYLAPIFDYEITIDNTLNSNALTDYQILLNVSNDSVFFATIQDRKYMEFYDEDKITLLSHYVELWDTTNYNAKIWIKIPSIPANRTKKIYLKVNTERTEDLSNVNNVFPLYDDFERSNVEEGWTRTDQSKSPNSNPANSGAHFDPNFVYHGSKALGQQDELDPTDVFWTKTVNVPIGGLGFEGAEALDRWNGGGTNGWVELILMLNTVNLHYLCTPGSTPSDTDTDKYFSIPWSNKTWKHFFRSISADLNAKGVSATTIQSVRMRFYKNASGTGFTGYFDYLILRGYASPEPQVSYTKL